MTITTKDFPAFRVVLVRHMISCDIGNPVIDLTGIFGGSEEQGCVSLRA